MNRYNYVKGSSVNFIDPTGLFGECGTRIVAYEWVDENGELQQGVNVQALPCPVLPGFEEGGPGAPSSPCGNNPCPEPPGEGGSDPSKEDDSEEDCSPPVTTDERLNVALARERLSQGDLAGARRALGNFWDSRAERGDTWSVTGRGIWSDNATAFERGIGVSALTFLGSTAAAGLVLDSQTPIPIPGTIVTPHVLVDIGVGLAEEHNTASTNVFTSGSLSFSRVASYHHRVFARHNIGPNSYGGTPLGPVFTEAQGSVFNDVFRFRAPCMNSN